MSLALAAGVGRVLVRRLAGQGASLGLLARGIEGLEGARREAESAGARVLTVPTDVADAVEVEAAADRIDESSDPLTWG